MEPSEPLAQALHALAMAQVGSKAADAVLMDALLAVLCRTLPPLCAPIRETLEQLAQLPQGLQYASVPAFHSRVAVHLRTLDALAKAPPAG